MSTIKVGILGCGFIGTVHAFALQALVAGGLVDAEVVAFGDSDPVKARGLAELHGTGAAVHVDDVRGLVSASDAVWVCTPTSNHLELVARVAAAGKAIYCEKPLAPDLPTAEALVAAAQRAGIPHQVGLVLRSAPGVTATARALGVESPSRFTVPEAPLEPVERVGESWEAGGRDLWEVATEGGQARVMAAVLRDDQYFPTQGIYGSTWRSDVDISGGGTLIEHSIHDLDLLTWLLGPAETVSARTGNFAGHPGIEDLASVTISHAGGAVSTLVSVWHGMLTRPSTRRLEVFCERAHLVLEDEHVGPLRVELDTGSEDVGLLAEARAVLERLGTVEELRVPLLSYAMADGSFLRSVAEGSKPEPGFEVGLQAHRVADAAYRSAAMGGVPVSVGQRDF
ncbi:MAG: Gfo/Idh/MocA family oxidoreductase [Actinobacteria bacterium]|nr:Gfo/Idh/MocA family oxidoreductase [Actinomycetota bacterium]MDA8184204.1 Gfo/Idh/MocA family oxidoreductase [Actinomycetota bacterium]